MTRGVASGCIANGGGLLVGQDWTEDGVWLIRAQTTRRPASAEGTWVPLAALTTPRMCVLPPWEIGPGPSGGWNRPSHHASLRKCWGIAEQDSTDLVEFAADALGFEGSKAHMMAIGGDLFVRGDSRLEQEVSGLMRTWSAQLSRTVEVELRFGLLEPGRGGAVARGEVPVAALASELDHRLRGACRVGDCLSLIGGRESMYLKDYDVEIAQAAVSADPIIDVFLEGISFWCLPTVETTGRLTVLVEVEMQQALGDWESVPVSFHRGIEVVGESKKPPLNGAIEKTASSRADISQVVRPEGGAWILVGCHSLPGMNRAFVAVLRAEVRGGA